MTIPTPELIDAVPGAFNLRELGGYRVADGAIRRGAIYRSDLLNRLDVGAARRWLTRSGISVLVDLRTTLERDTDGHVEADRLDARHRSLLDDVWSWRDEKESGNEWFLRDRTVEMYDRHGDRIVEVLADLATSAGPVLFHCTAGKDRTGVVASALLGVLGADDEVIVADYARSTDAMVRIVEWYRDQAIREAIETGQRPPQFSEEEGREIIRRAAAPETMRAVISEIRERWGSFEGWAKHSGADDSLIGALRAKFVV